MPGLDGFETTQDETDGRLRHVPVIFMTGLTETEHVVRGLEAGAVDYVTSRSSWTNCWRAFGPLANARIAQGTRAALDASGRFSWQSTAKARSCGRRPKHINYSRTTSALSTARR